MCSKTRGSKKEILVDVKMFSVSAHVLHGNPLIFLINDFYFKENVLKDFACSLHETENEGLYA